MCTDQKLWVDGIVGTLFLAVPSVQLQPNRVITVDLETKMWNILVGADLGLGNCAWIKDQML